MGDRRFEINWPVVALVGILLAVVVTAIKPEVWTLVTDSIVRVVQSFRGVFR